MNVTTIHKGSQRSAAMLILWLSRHRALDSGSADLAQLARHLAAAAAPHEHAVAEARALDALLFAQRAREDAGVAAAQEAVQQAAHEARAQVALLVDLARRAARTAAHLHARAAVAEAVKESVRPFFRHRERAGVLVSLLLLLLGRRWLDGRLR